jgi:hypothetical protein
VQNRERLTIGELRKVLRPWIGEAAHPPRRPTRESFAPEVEPITKDLACVRAQFAAMQPVTMKRPLWMLTVRRLAYQIKRRDPSRWEVPTTSGLLVDFKYI